MPKTITQAEAVAMLREIVIQSGSQLAAAKRLNISPAYLIAILNGERTVSDRVAQALGYRRVVQYIKIKEGE